ncbi:MAG: hypothetical protein JWN51_3650 [Phycisphaerales bacterium]|nr:hypothetical protein [Phycisphaerales bacterium]
MGRWLSDHPSATFRLPSKGCGVNSLGAGIVAPRHCGDLSMRIIYVGDMDPGGTCLQRLKALQDLGHEVQALDYRVLAGRNTVRGLICRVGYKLRRPVDFARVNRQIIQCCRTSEADILWIDKGLVVWPQTLAAVRRMRPGMVIAGYSPDDMGSRHNQSDYFVRGLPLHDIYFTTKSYGVAELRQLGVPRVEFSANAYDRNTHRPISLNAQDLQKYGAEVGFVGTYERFRAQSMIHLAGNGIPVRIFGDWWPPLPDAPKMLNLVGSAIYADEYAKAICGAKINLCFLRKLNRDLQTQRSVEIPACGAFMLAERTDEHRGLFEEGKEAEFFSSDQELLEKVRYYLDHAKERERIAAAGRERCIQSGYSYHDRLRQALAQIFEAGGAKQNPPVPSGV